MADVGGVGRAGGTESTYRNNNVPTSEGNSSLSISDFYKLMAAQLQYQDPDNPASTSDMMASMVQTQMVEAITQMSAMSSTTYVASMVGKKVTIAEVDKDGKYTGDTVGVVTSVVLGNNPAVYVDGKPYSLSQIMAIGDKIPKPEPPKDQNDGTNGDGGNSGGNKDK